MNAPRTPAYGQPLSPAKSPRDAEAAILARITAQMLAGAGRGRDGFGQLTAALSDNRRFWTACATDLAGDGNGLPPALRAQLISLAGFVVGHSSRVLAGTASVEPLVAVNRAIIEGLGTESLAA